MRAAVSFGRSKPDVKKRGPLIINLLLFCCYTISTSVTFVLRCWMYVSTLLHQTEYGPLRETRRHNYNTSQRMHMTLDQRYV